MGAGPMIYLGVTDADSAIAFYVAAFAAEEQYRLVGPDQSVMHAELSMFGATLMLAETGAAAAAGSSARFVVPVADCDTATDKAKRAGAEVLRTPEDQFHGARQALVRCPSGYEWFLSEQRDELDIATIKSRFAALFDA
ncbi:MAG: VOC family protein [Pseudomonadota bacterium]